MKAVVLYGSPRKEGDSATLAKQFIKGLNENNDFQIEHFYLNEMNIKHCQGCLSCARNEDNNCIIDDDMQKIYPAYSEAKIIVWATSMFWGYLTSQLKTALDRMEALGMRPERFNNKTFVVVLTYSHHYETAANFFKRIAPFHNIDLHFLNYGSFDKEKNCHVHVSNNKEKLDEAINLGIRIKEKFT